MLGDNPSIYQNLMCINKNLSNMQNKENYFKFLRSGSLNGELNVGILTLVSLLDFILPSFRAFIHQKIHWFMVLIYILLKLTLNFYHLIKI